MEIIKYPDGSSYVTIPRDWEYTHQKITFRINNYEDVIHLVQLCDVLRYNNINAQITIPCMLDAQADYRFNDYQSSGLKIITDILKDACMDSEIYFKVFHPHNKEVLKALMPNTEIIDNSRFVAEVITKVTGCSFDNGTLRAWDDRKDSDGLSSIDKFNNLILMSSDAGGFKPLMKLCDKIRWSGETVSASKYRSVSTVNGEITTKLQQFVGNTDFNGKDILIVDDICIYGGTFKGLAKILKERNCGKLYLAVSHMTVQDLGEDPVTNYFDKVFTTNSKYDNYFVKDSVAGGKQPENLTIIEMF
jgi:ribose-phosphate pyrophosphokinase